MRVLILGNGINIEAFGDTGVFPDVLNEPLKWLEEEFGKIDFSIEHSLPNPAAEGTQIVANLHKYLKRTVNKHLYNPDFETYCSLFIMSKKYAKNSKVGEEIIKKINFKTNKHVLETFNSERIRELVYNDRMIKKLKTYDLIITANYDLILEQSGIEIKKIEHIHGSTVNNDIKIGPMTAKKDIYEKIVKLFENDSELKIDIFGMNISNETHIMQSILALHTKDKIDSINHYTYNLGSEHGLTQNIVDNISWMAFGVDFVTKKNSSIRRMLIGGDNQRKGLFKALESLEKIYSEHESYGWIPGSDIATAIAPNFFELFKKSDSTENNSDD